MDANLAGITYLLVITLVFGAFVVLGVWLMRAVSRRRDTVAQPAGEAVTYIGFRDDSDAERVAFYALFSTADRREIELPVAAMTVRDLAPGTEGRLVHDGNRLISFTPRR